MSLFRRKKTEKTNAEKEVERAKEFAKRLEASEEWKKKQKKKEEKRNKNAASLKTNKPKKGVFAGIKDLFSRKKKNLKYYPPVAAFNARGNPINIKPFSFNNTKSASKKTSASKTKKRGANALLANVNVSPFNNTNIQWNMSPMSSKKSLTKSKSATRKQGPSKEMQKILKGMPAKLKYEGNLESIFKKPITRKRPQNVMSPLPLVPVAKANNTNWITFDKVPLPLVPVAKANNTNWSAKLSSAFKSNKFSSPKKGENDKKLLELTKRTDNLQKEVTKRIDNLQKEVKQIYRNSIQGIVRNKNGNPIGFTHVGSYTMS